MSNNTKKNKTDFLQPILATVKDKESESELSFIMTKITPSYAKKLLESNHVDQRTLSDKTIKQYATDMKNGLWTSGNGEVLKISSDGNMIDGQHRMKAVIESGVSVNMIVCSGIYEDNMSTIDNGKPRSAGDMLEIQLAERGTFCKSHVAGALRLMMHLKMQHEFENNIRLRNLSGVRKISNVETLTYFNKFDDFLGDYFNFRDLYNLKKLNLASSPTACLVFWLLFNDYAEEECTHVLRTFESGFPFDNTFGQDDASFKIYSDVMKKKALNSANKMKFCYKVYDCFDFLCWAFIRALAKRSVKRCNVSVIGEDIYRALPKSAYDHMYRIIC